MAVKELALITEKKKRKKKESVQAAPTKPIKETISNNKGTTKINRSTISTKPSAQKTPQNRVVTNKERLTSKPTISDIRTVKTSNFKPKSIQTVDLYERGGRYFYKDGKKEKEVDQKFVQDALKNKRTGVIGRYDSKGTLRATDKKGNVKKQSLLDKAGFLGRTAGTRAIKGTTSIVDAALQETQNDLQKGKDIKSPLAKLSQLTKAIMNADPRKGMESAIVEAAQKSKAIWKDKDKNILEKYIGSVMEGSQAVSTGATKGVKDLTSLVGSYDKNLDKEVAKVQKKIDEPVNKEIEKLEREKYKYGKGMRTASDIVGTTANMAPGIIASAVTRNPNIGIATMGLSAKGQATEEALKQGADLDTAVKMGTTKGLVEAGTEKLSSGLKIFGKGPTGKWLNEGGTLDDLIEGTLDKKIKNKGMNFLAKQGFGLTGEIAEETISDLAGVMIDKGTINPDANYTWEDFLETAKNTFGSTLLTNLLTGGYGSGAYRQNTINMQNNQIKQAQLEEIGQKVESGEVTQDEVRELVKQVENGTYSQNNNLDTIAIQQREQLDKQLQQGLITDEQYNQELRNIANATKQTRKQINTPQNQVETQPQTNETTQDNAITQETQNVAQNEQNEGAQESAFNNVKLEERVSGDKLLDTQDFINEVKNVGAKVDGNGYVTVYHQTTPENAQKILDSGKMTSNEQGVFFSTSENASQADGRGNVKLEFKIPAENLELDDLFSDNADVKIPLKGQSNIDVSNYIVNNNVANNQNNQGENRVNDHTLEYNGYYIMSEKPNVGYEYKSLEESPRFQIYDANNDDITHNVANWVNSIDEAKQYIDSLNKLNGKNKQQQAIEKNQNIAKEQENISQKTTETTQQEERKQPEILDKMPTEKKSTLKSLKKGIDTFRKEITDAFAPIYDIARKTRNMTLYHKADKILGSDGMAQVDLGRNQVDLKGKPFKNFTDENGNKVSMSWEKAYDSYSKIPNKAKNEFLVHQLNIDRLNQGVDQFDIPLQESRQRVEELRKQYKDIDKWSENTYQFYRNLIQNMVDNGRIPQSLADKWLKETPHFIHIERQVPNKGNQGVSVKNGKVDSDNLIRKIKGGNYAILPIKETTANYVQNARRAFAFNDFGKEYARTIGTDARGENVSADTDIDEIFGFEPEFVNSDGSGNYTLKIYENGTPVEIPISEDVYNSLSPKTIPRVGVLAEATKVYKDLLTNKNPFFGFLRNPIKDVGDMFLYSKHPLYKSLKTYTKLFGGRTALRNRKITKDGVTAQDIVDFYHNTGNAVHSFYKNGQFESNKGNAEKGVDKVLSPIEKGNDFMESMPRITEFWNTIESEGYTIKDGELVPQKGKTPKKTVEQVIAEASYNAADVTVNFKRGGRTSKMISQNGGIFFNPSVQGASKFTRNITEAVGDAKAGDFQAAKRLILRAAGMGVAPAILNAIMYGDDDDYKELQDYQKDQYYLINKKLIADKLGIDNDFKKDPWIRIPKGRAVSLFESATRRALDKGKGGKFGAKEYGKLALNQIAPSNPLDNNIFSPITSAIANKSWSGNPIVSKYMEDNLATEDQFNEKTDEFSKWLGKQTKISPMKINYVLDQYSGVLGDLILPQITPKATTGSSNPVMNILRDNYYFNAANSSKNTNEFYDNKSKINKKFKKANASDETKLQKAYMGTMSQELYPLTEKKRNIQMDKNLSKKEKYEQALEVQKQINELTKKAVKNLESAKVDKYTATIGGKLFYRNEDARNGTGWSQENEETTQKREALGLSPEKYYYYKNDESYKTSDGYTKSITSGKNAKQTIAMVEAFNFDPSDYLEYKSKLSKIRGDKGANGKTIRYSARKKKIAYLNTLPISSVEKAYLMKQSDRYYKSSDKSLKKAIKSSSMSEEDKKQIYSYLRLGR